MNKKSGTPYFGALEIARGIAAIMVLLFHASAITGYQFTGGDNERAFGNFFLFGRAGVDFFFVLSGFIITFIHFHDIGDSSKISVYSWKRFARIYPLYWIASCLMLLLFAATAITEGSAFPFNWQQIVLAFSLLKVSGVEYPLGVAWSLSDEVFFYMLFGLGMLSRKAAIFIFSIWAVCILLNDILLIPMGPLNHVLSPFHIEFLFGIATAVLLRIGIRLFSVNIFLYGGITLFLLTGLVETHFIPFKQQWELLTVYGLASAAVVFAIAQREMEEKRTYSPSLMLLGNASYSVYLLHIPLLIMVTEILSRILPSSTTSEIGFIISCPVVIALSLIFHKIVEVRTLSLSKRISQKIVRQQASR